MSWGQWLKLAVGTALIAGVAAISTGRLPRWLRIAVIVAVVVLASGVGLFAYRQATQPTTLTVAAGSMDGESARLMSAIAARLNVTGAPVRLKVLDKGTVLEAVKTFSAGQADLAIARGDIGDLSAARTVVRVTHAVVLIVTPPGSPVESIDDLKGKTVGVIGADVNQRVVAAITDEYDLDRAKVRFTDLAPKDGPHAVQSKQVQAVLVVMPISEKYLAMLRDLFPQNAKLKPGLVPIESAGAIAAVARSYESYDLPKGTIRGSPPVPDDDLTTLRVPFYLVANNKLDNDVVTALTKAIMETRRDLMGEHPLLAHVSTPSTDKDALVPIHPGAAAYFDGDQKTFFDKYGDQIFYGSLLLGSFTSLLAAVWKFMIKDVGQPEASPLIRLYELSGDIRAAGNEADLAETEQRIDDILRRELERYASGDADSGESAALGLATHRLEYLIGQRRAALSGPSTSSPRAQRAPVMPELRKVD
jgi:TRAP transporter TAXI family solute receptor